MGCITMMWGREGLYNEKVSSVYCKGTLYQVFLISIWHKCEFHCCLQLRCERPWFWGTIEWKGFPVRIAKTPLLCLLYVKFLFSIQTKNWLDKNGLDAIVCILNKALSRILGALLHSFSFVFKANVWWWKQFKLVGDVMLKWRSETEVELMMGSQSWSSLISLNDSLIFEHITK